MFKFKMSYSWARKMAALEEDHEMSVVGGQMEKLGIANADLLNELKNEYRVLKEQEAQMLKIGHGNTLVIAVEMKRIKSKIDELEAQDG